MSISTSRKSKPPRNWDGLQLKVIARYPEIFTLILRERESQALNIPRFAFSRKNFPRTPPQNSLTGESISSFFAIMCDKTNFSLKVIFRRQFVIGELYWQVS